MKDTSPEPADEHVTLATLRDWAERTIALTAESPRLSAGGGARQAARDVLAILDMNGRPANEPVTFSLEPGGHLPCDRVTRPPRMEGLP